MPVFHTLGEVMSKKLVLVAALAPLVLAGCQSDAQILASEQATATQVATRRGQFEMSCPQATGTILSSNMLQPVVWGGMERAEYTVGVEGCGQRRTYIVLCQVGSVSCFAGAGRP
jgi:hypothetical protein